MIRILRLLLGFVGVLIVGTFAIANRGPIDVSFAPLPVVVELPVYGVFLLGLVVGGLIGGAAVWLGESPGRRQARRMRNRVWALENQLGILKKQEDTARAAQDPAQRAVVAQGAGD